MTDLLRTLEVPVPCTESWDAMQGDEQVRHCGLCRKNVFNLSAMPQAEAAALLAAHADGGVCVRFFRRSDGTVMTSDCGASPRVKLRRVMRTLPRAAAGAAGVAGAAVVAVAVAHAKPPALHGAPEPYVVMVSLEEDARRLPPTMGVPVMTLPEATLGKPAVTHEPAHAVAEPVDDPEDGPADDAGSGDADADGRSQPAQPKNEGQA